MIQDIHPHQFSNQYIASSAIQKDDYIFHFKDNALLLKSSGEDLSLPRKKELAECSEDGIFMFTFNHVHCFLIWDCPKFENRDYSYHEIQFRNPFSQKEMDWVSGVALQLKNWYLLHKFCGKCGTPTVQKKDERALLCPACNTILFPTISPAIIVAILSKNKILLARNVNFPEAYYSLVAGYVDVGESIEETIVREVKEEVGLTIKNIRYYKSQPWPFSGSMMIGFIAEADEDQAIKVDNIEIMEAAWFDRHNLPNHPRERSIAGEMIEKFKNDILE